MDRVPPVDVRFPVAANSSTGLGKPPLPPVIQTLCKEKFAAAAKRGRRLRTDTDDRRTC